MQLCIVSSRALLLQHCQIFQFKEAIFESLGAGRFSVEEHAMAGAEPDKIFCNNVPRLAKSSVNIAQLAAELKDYKEPEASILLNSFKNGFSIHYSGPL